MAQKQRYDYGSYGSGKPVLLLFLLHQPHHFPSYHSIFLTSLRLSPLFVPGSRYNATACHASRRVGVREGGGTKYKGGYLQYTPFTVFILTLFPGCCLPLVLPPLLVQLVELLDENAARGVCDGRHVVPMLLHAKQSQIIIMCIAISRRRKWIVLVISVADPGCLSRFRIFSIPDPWSKRFPDP